MSVEELEEEEQYFEQDGREIVVDGQGEIIYDHNVALPDYQLFTLRNNSCLDFNKLIDLNQISGTSLKRSSSQMSRSRTQSKEVPMSDREENNK